MLDGPAGTLLEASGVATEGPAWSAHAVLREPARVASVHRAYAAAGATVHTTVTFRARPEALGAEWAPTVREAVALARASVPAAHRVVGSVGPVADCYRPWEAPVDAEARHARLAEALAGHGVDGILLEAMGEGEALPATRAALATGLPVWLALTAGPDGDLLSPERLARVASDAVALGASVVLVNCVAARRTLPFVEALARVGAPFGAYANASTLGGAPIGPTAYAAEARRWLAAGASVVGACCGCGPGHVAALSAETRPATLRPGVPCD